MAPSPNKNSLASNLPENSHSSARFKMLVLERPQSSKVVPCIACTTNGVTKTQDKGPKFAVPQRVLEHCTKY
jgi:hypothetical protein